MNIRAASRADLPPIAEIYAEARAFMRASGNLQQWQGGYPPEDVIVRDIEDGCLYVVKEGEEPVAVFFFRIGDDPTYSVIYGGEWKNSAPYGVIHRVAVSAKAHGRGVGALIFNHCFGIIGNLKIDTHRDNIPMQKSLAKAGFEYCGIIHLANGDERLAYQKTSK